MRQLRFVLLLRRVGLTTTAGLLMGWAGMGAAQAEGLSLEQVLERGLTHSASLEAADQRVRRDGAVVELNRSLRQPRLSLVASASYTQIGTSVGVLTSLPTLGDLSLSLSNGGYAVLQNSFANAGAIFELNLLPLRLNALVDASRAQVESSRASRAENERQTRFALASAYHQLQLSQALIPVWQEALKASSALLKDARAFRQAGLAARIDELRSRALQASDARGLAQAQASLAQDQTRLRVLLALPSSEPLLASDPIGGQPAWPLDLATTEARALQERPLLEALRQQQQVQRQQARASRAQLLPSITLLAGAGLSSDTLNTPVLSNSVGVSGTVTGSLPTLDTPSSASGQYYNWGAALLVRQPLLDGGQARAGARVAEREAAVLAADEEMARRQILQVVGETWSALQAAPTAIAAAQAAVVANERALADARLRYRAMVEPLTETLLVQRDLQAARASLLTTLTRQAIDRAVLVRELGADPPR